MLRLDEVERPTPKEDEVVAWVHATLGGAVRLCVASCIIVHPRRRLRPLGFARWRLRPRLGDGRNPLLGERRQRLDAFGRRHARAAGELVLIDGHALAKMVAATDPLRLSAPYGGGAPQHIAEGWDYATEALTGPQVQFAHSLGEIITAAAAAGLSVIELVEHMGRLDRSLFGVQGA